VAVPDYQTLMRPTLAALSDGRPQTRSQLREVVAPAAGVFGDDLLEMLPSRKATVFGSRVGWALTYMSQAGLITRPKRGVYVIRPGPASPPSAPRPGGQQGSATVPRVLGIQEPTQRERRAASRSTPAGPGPEVLYRRVAPRLTEWLVRPAPERLRMARHHGWSTTPFPLTTQPPTSLLISRRRGCEAGVDCSGNAAAGLLTLKRTGTWEGCTFVGEGGQISFPVSDTIGSPEAPQICFQAVPLPVSLLG